MVLRSVSAPPAEPEIPGADENLARHLQKCTKAFRKFSALGILQEDQIQFLTTINNEAKVRRWTKPLVLGKVNVMSYDDLEEARAKRVVKDAARVGKGKGKRGRKSIWTPPDAEEGTAEAARCGRKRKNKSAVLEAPESTNKVARMSNGPKPGHLIERKRIKEPTFMGYSVDQAFVSVQFTVRRDKKGQSTRRVSADQESINADGRGSIIDNLRESDGVDVKDSGLADSSRASAYWCTCAFLVTHTVLSKVLDINLGKAYEDVA
ncbi:hypothetical protein BJ878DRAFT_475781 [Calycina marina]|uniref:Uncharacterized protein n=1 Tax=Calycina marina TaxID=1763456 RepID=A0A9P7ZC45_9HELO|nr:hypothetical protein BJ878DRAFT_475781 [Calycina marina]